MKSVTVAAAGVVVLARAIVAQQSNATTSSSSFANATALALVAAQYNNSGFNYHIDNSESFGVPLNNNALLQVNYPGIGLVQNGAAYTAAQVATRPTSTFIDASGRLAKVY